MPDDSQEERVDDVDDADLDEDQGERLPHDGMIPLSDEEKQLGRRLRPAKQNPGICPPGRPPA